MKVTEDKRLMKKSVFLYYSYYRFYYLCVLTQLIKAFQKSFCNRAHQAPLALNGGINLHLSFLLH